MNPHRQAGSIDFSNVCQGEHKCECYLTNIARSLFYSSGHEKSEKLSLLGVTGKALPTRRLAKEISFSDG